MNFAGFAILVLVGSFALVMCWLLALGVRNVWRGLASNGWPATEGVVSKVETTSSTRRDERGRTSTTYGADLTIRYTVNRDEFTTDQITWGQTLGSGDASEAVVLALRYPEGRRVQVRFNPSKPGEAVVKPGLKASAFLLPGSAIVFLLFLIPACFLLWRLTFGSVAGTDAAPKNLGGVMRAILCVPMIFGAGMLAVGVRNLSLGSKSAHWPTVSGVWLKDSSSSTPAGMAVIQGHLGLDYVYQYEVSGETHFNNVRWFGQGTATGNNPEPEIAREYPRGGPLTVHYDPRDPDCSVLRPGVQGFAWILPGAGVAFLLFGIIGMGVLGRR
jgi:hypothetical protein